MLTASQLIRQAALLTKVVATPSGKTVEYANGPPLQQVKDDTCWLCGGETEGRGLPTKKAIKQTFTDHPYARGQGSKSVCAGCAFVLSRRELRNYSILATKHGLWHPSRAEWKGILLEPPRPPFVACLAVSGQKHLSFKAPVNMDNRYFTVLLEERLIHIIPARLADCLEGVQALYAYFNKEEIATGRYNQNRIKECGLARWQQLEARVEAWRGKPLFELALFVAQKPEEVEKDEPKTEATLITSRKAADTGTIQLGFDGL